MQLADNSVAVVLSKAEQFKLNRLKEILTRETDLVYPQDDPVYLLKYLRYKKGDVDKAAKAVVGWWKMRHRLSDLHENLQPSYFKEHYAKKFSTTAAYRDSFGRQLMIWNLKNWDPKSMSFIDMLKSNFCVVDTITRRHLTQLNGVIYIFDMSGLGLAHARAITPYCLKTMLGLTEGFPLKIKEIHFINHPSFFNAVIAIGKMFMKPKMKQRLQFHGYNVASLHEFIDPAILPKVYGGCLEDEEFEEEGFVQEMMDKEQYYHEFFDVRKYGYLVHSKDA